VPHEGMLARVGYTDEFLLQASFTGFLRVIARVGNPKASFYVVQL